MIGYPTVGFDSHEIPDKILQLHFDCISLEMIYKPKRATFTHSVFH